MIETSATCPLQELAGTLLSSILTQLLLSLSPSFLHFFFPPDAPTLPFPHTLSSSLAALTLHSLLSDSGTAAFLSRARECKKFPYTNSLWNCIVISDNVHEIMHPLFGDIEGKGFLPDHYVEDELRDP